MIKRFHRSLFGDQHYHHTLQCKSSKPAYEIKHKQSFRGEIVDLAPNKFNDYTLSSLIKLAHTYTVALSFEEIRWHFQHKMPTQIVELAPLYAVSDLYLTWFTQRQVKVVAVLV